MTGLENHYDTATNGRGRMGWSWTLGSNATASGFTAYDVMGRPTGFYQQYNVNGTWGTQFTVSRSYDLDRHITSQT